MKYLFDQKEEISAGLFGTKAENLAWLERQGFQIPLSFFISVKAFEYALKSVNSAFDSHTHINKSNLTVLADELVAELKNFLAELPDPDKTLLAVRSSSTFEDQPEQSFAGLYKSVLKVKPDLSSLTDAILKVWNSAFSEPVVKYCRQNKIDPGLIKMGVIIQEMIQADYSGVMFTSNPANASNDVRIEFLKGASDSLVSGDATPSVIIYNRRSKLIKRNDTENNHSFNDDLVKRLIEAGIKIENLKGSPADIEWAVKNNTFYFLQYRPVTHKADQFADRIEWTDENVGEVIPDVVTPFSWSILQPMVNNAVLWFLKKISIKQYPSDGLFGLYKGKVYFNHTEFNRLINRFYLSVHLSANKKLTIFQKMITSLKLLRFAFSAIAFILILPRSIKQKLSLNISVMNQKSNPQESINEISELIHEETAIMYYHISATILAELYFQAIKKYAAKWFYNEQGLFAESLMQGSTQTSGAESGAALWELTGRYKKNEEFRQLFNNSAPSEIDARLAGINQKNIRQEIDDFFKKYGHNALREFELLYPRWHEDRLYIYSLIKNYLNNIERENPAEHRQRLLMEGKIKRVQALKRLKLMKRIFFKYLINNTIKFSVYREQLKQHFLRLHHQFRNQLLYLSSMMDFDQPDDIFYLTYDELKSLTISSTDHKSLQSTIFTRKTERQHNLNYNHPPKVIQQDEQWHEIWLKEENTVNALNGIACSAGIAEGRARVIIQADRAKDLESGDILVAHSTNPSWTPLFLVAAGIVTEIGGALSHGAIIAREYGKPMVAAVPGIIKNIHDGDWLRVNGHTGQVFIVQTHGEPVNS